MSAKDLVQIIDDDDALRDSLTFLLSSAGIEAKSYESAGAYLNDPQRGAAGCIITDVRMPGMSGIDLLRKLKSDGVALPVIVMTGHGDVPLAVEAMKLGAFDFIEKPFEDDALLASVRGALGVQEKHTRQESQRQEIESRLTQLSTRERQVLDGLVAGQANKVIAYELGISPRTVEIYRANVMTKMQANSLSDLVRMALVTGTLKGEG
ncbi:MAG: response regulator transcription factor FixJ [Xanthobacteraceae bacterium]|nr:response regulator transcription factor FixJ [Xanthobacteraceae bacterium]MBV9627577.1 response regulator transcription factor FixJ [Xanthobacteraceae bacterium]